MRLPGSVAKSSAFNSSLRAKVRRGEVDRGGSLRDCLNRVVILGEQHLRHLLNSYQSYKKVGTQLSLKGDTLRDNQWVGLSPHESRAGDNLSECGAL
jgi:hypothetical protein